MDVWSEGGGEGVGGEGVVRLGNVSLHLNLDVNFTTAAEGLESENGSSPS